MFLVPSTTRTVSGTLDISFKLRIIRAASFSSQIQEFSQTPYYSQI